MRQTFAIFIIVLLQVASTVFYVSDTFSSFFSLWSQPISWQYRELIEMGAAVSLLAGLIFGSFLLYRSLARQRHAESQLRLASGAFMELVNEEFDAWGLTRSERDVGMFLLKGVPIREIAAMRNTSEGTVKAQSSAIYRKAGVSGRAELLSLFIEDLLGDGLVGSPSKAPEPAGQRKMALAGK